MSRTASGRGAGCEGAGQGLPALPCQACPGSRIEWWADYYWLSSRLHRNKRNAFRTFCLSVRGSEIHPHGAHIIIYRDIDSDILIIRVRHGREDWLRDGD
jgi:hypothetical protein